MVYLQSPNWQQSQIKQAFPVQDWWKFEKLFEKHKKSAVLYYCVISTILRRSANLNTITE